MQVATIQSMLDRAYPRGNQRACGFISEADFRPYQDLDGAAARKFLEANGYTVTANADLGTSGVAVTSCGWVLSTNGYVYYNAPAAQNIAERIARMSALA